MKKVIGKVTEEEKQQIKDINEHKNSLEELLLILPQECELYQKALDEMNNTMNAYQEWWSTHYNKYHWEKGNTNWTILFETNEIIIES